MLIISAQNLLTSSHLTQTKSQCSQHGRHGSHFDLPLLPCLVNTLTSLLQLPPSWSTWASWPFLDPLTCPFPHPDPLIERPALCLELSSPHTAPWLSLLLVWVFSRCSLSPSQGGPHLPHQHYIPEIPPPPLLFFLSRALITIQYLIQFTC